MTTNNKLLVIAQELDEEGHRIIAVTLRSIVEIEKLNDTIERLREENLKYWQDLEKFREQADLALAVRLAATKENNNED